jgi:H+/gluconate symporter-like permease
MLGSITLIIIFGTCIRKLTVSSGAASVIADTVMKWTGKICASGAYDYWVYRWDTFVL